MALAVAIDDVELGHLQPLQHRLELGKRPRFRHVPVLQKPAGSIQAGDLQRQQLAVFLGEHRPVDRRANDQWLGRQRPVGLTDLVSGLPRREGPHLAVEQIAAGRSLEFIVGGAQQGVDRVGEAHPLVEGKPQHRQPDLGRAVELKAGIVQVGLEIGEKAGGPGQVWIGQQQGLAAGRLGRRDSPGVGAGSIPTAGRAGLRRDVDVLHQPVGMGHDVDTTHRQHLAHRRVELVGVRFGVRIDALSIGVEILAELGRLLAIPLRRALRHAVAEDPLVGLDIGRAAPVFRRPPPRLAIEPQHDIAVVLGRRIAEAVKSPRLVATVDVRHAIAVPQDLTARPRRR